MTSEHGDYRQYLLRQVVRSLSDPYDPRPNLPQQPSALDLISDGLVAAGGLEAPMIDRLREADDDNALADAVTAAADALTEAIDAAGHPRFGGVDLNTLRILLYRQSTRKPIQRRVASFLNGVPLADADWQKLAAMPKNCDRGPMNLLTQLARVTLASLGGPLIVCVDQIEASDITGTNHEPFIHAMSTACEIIENVSGCMVLLSCLDSAYDAHAPHLIASYCHRIENDPPPVRLTASRTEFELRQVISRRVKWLYESEGLEHHPPDSVYPMPEDVPARLKGQDIRTTLQQAHRFWEKLRSADVGTIPPWPGERPPIGPVDHPDADRLRIAWNEYRTNGAHAISEDDAAQLDLFEWALNAASAELEPGAKVAVSRPPTSGGSDALFVKVQLPRTPALARLVALCDKGAQGGGLMRQINAAAGLRIGPDQTLVVLRSTQFPRTGATIDKINQMRSAGDRFAVVDAPAWQTMQAMKTFLGTEAAKYAPDVVRDWRRTDGPLVSLPGLSEIVQPPPRPVIDAAAGLRKPDVRSPEIRTPDIRTPDVRTPDVRTPDARKPSVRTAAEPTDPLPEQPRAMYPEGSKDDTLPFPTPPPSPPRPTPPPTPPPPLLPPVTPAPLSLPPATPAAGPFVIGTTEGFNPADVTLDPQILTRHTAIFGANGSGKTVLALTILEMLLERGVNVALFDRKGDLASYAVEESWREKTGAPDEDRRRPALREKIGVHLYTPGAPAGRPLVLPLLPAGLAKRPAEGRQEEARQAAVILCDVCGPSAARADMFTTVLARSIELLCAADTQRTLDDLERLLLTPPPDLLDLLPAHTEKHCEEVGRKLNERRVAHGRLFSDVGEKLDLPTMLAPAGGKTRLNIISTQFLDGDSGLIWVAQFLAAAGRYIADSPSPGGRLQAVLMFDEADQYIPAVSKPATKPGLDNLIRRGRAAGVGIMLATQNAGDFDYRALDNVTTVFAGKLTTSRARDKLRPRLNDAADRLAKKGKGQFVMGIETEIRDIRGHMCLIRPTPVPRDRIEQIAAAQARGDAV